MSAGWEAGSVHMPVRGGDFIALAQAVHRKSVSQSQFVEQCCSSVI